MPTGICRACGTPLSKTFANLGLSPLSNSFVKPDQAKAGEIWYPLHAYVCDSCFLVQLEEFATPNQIFDEYSYFSSFSSSWLKHAEDYAAGMIARFGLSPSAKVVEVASNDGYLLQNFVTRGIAVLGVEPAANVAKAAERKGVPTEVAFFGQETARRLLGMGHAADLMVANNVLAHVPGILDFVEGFSVLLKPDGVGTFEFPHLLRMIELKQFDTIYHEHFSYLSLGVVADILRRCRLRVFDVEELKSHGGSLRVFFCHENATHEQTADVDRVIELERAYDLGSLQGYVGFQDEIVNIKCEVLDFLMAARRDGKIVCGYGAAAKGNTLLNYCGIGPEFIKLVADISPYKQDTLLPGSRIPVRAPADLNVVKPDYVMILPWNLREEIMDEMAGVREWGCRFVTAIPRLEIV